MAAFIHVVQLQLGSWLYLLVDDVITRLRKWHLA